MRRANAYRGKPLALTAVTAGLLALPAVATAGSGGGGIGPSGNKQARPAGGTVSSTVNGMTITTHASGFDGHTMTLLGSVGRRHAGQTIVIQRAGGQTGGAWVKTARATVASDGSFEAVWDPNKAGQLALRAVLRRSRPGRAASAWPTVNVIVYRLSIATFYGPGLWGRTTACGQRLRHKTLGVANRRLPCGTKVSIYYGGRSIVVRVIDRGPYANGAHWDLTLATAKALRMPGTETIGAARLS